jgi:hypothetical protein
MVEKALLEIIDWRAFSTISTTPGITNRGVFYRKNNNF